MLNKTTESQITSQYYLEYLSSKEERSFVLLQTDFEKALNDLTPSVSIEELSRYVRLQSAFNSIV